VCENECVRASVSSVCVSARASVYECVSV